MESPTSFFVAVGPSFVDFQFFSCLINMYKADANWKSRYTLSSL